MPLCMFAVKLCDSNRTLLNPQKLDAISNWGRGGGGRIQFNMVVKKFINF